MTITVQQFRTDFSEFADVSAYPDGSIAFWLAASQQLLNPVVWTTMFDFACELLVAHAITIARRNLKAAQAGGAPGQFTGVLSNKAVGSVSAGYDTLTATVKDAGWLNLTTYGIQLAGYQDIFGAGGLQLGTGGGRAWPALSIWNDGNPPLPF